MVAPPFIVFGTMCDNFNLGLITKVGHERRCRLSENFEIQAHSHKCEKMQENRPNHFEVKNILGVVILGEFQNFGIKVHVLKLAFSIWKFKKFELWPKQKFI